MQQQQCPSSGPGGSRPWLRRRHCLIWGGRGEERGSCQIIQQLQYLWCSAALNIVLLKTYINNICSCYWLHSKHFKLYTHNFIFPKFWCKPEFLGTNFETGWRFLVPRIILYLKKALNAANQRSLALSVPETESLQKNMYFSRYLGEDRKKYTK